MIAQKFCVSIKKHLLKLKFKLPFIIPPKLLERLHFPKLRNYQALSY